MKTKPSFKIRPKTGVFVSLLIVSVGTTVFAQELNDEVTMVQSIWGSEKRQMMIDYMEIPDEQAAGFWRVYEDYETSRRRLAKERIMLINDYVNNFSSLSEEKADELATKMLVNNANEAKLRKQYYTRFKKASSAIDAAKFLQLDGYIQNTIRVALQDELPFIGELETKRKD